MAFTVDPIRMYENVNGICTVITAVQTLGTGNNQKIIDAVSGYRLRVMGWIMQSDGALLCKITFKSNSGGTTLCAPISLPASTSGIDNKLPIVDSGYFETITGQALYADLSTAGAFITIFYIQYIP